MGPWASDANFATVDDSGQRTTRIVSPIVLHFDEDETIFEVPIDARIPVDAALYVSAWIDTNPPMRKIVLPATPDPIVVTFAAKPHRMNTGLVVLRVSPRIGSGANEVPCNVKRFAKMADSLPGQIQEAQDKLSVLSKDISQAETKYDNLISQSGGANSAIIIAQQANVAAKARLAMLRGKQASLIRSGIRWKAQLEDLQKLIKVVRGYDGMTIQYRVYYLERKASSRLDRKQRRFAFHHRRPFGCAKPAAVSRQAERTY